MIVYSVAKFDLILLAGDIETAARRNHKAWILCGQMDKYPTAMAKVRAGARLTIATAPLLGQGVDVPTWHTLFMASPFAGGPRTVQAVGRICRAAPGKSSALVVDFVDARVPALVAARRQRVEALRRVA